MPPLPVDIREEEAKLIGVTSIRESLWLLFRLPLTVPLVALHPLAQLSGMQFTTTSRFIPNPPTLPEIDPIAGERRHHLLELTRQTFPDGRVPDPFTNWLSLSQDGAADRLPFIWALCIVITSTTGHNSKQSVFENVWCLWDTGAQTSIILTSLLDPAVRNNQDEGFAIMDISFLHTNQIVNSVICFHPTLPNDATFIILGQHGLLNHLQYQIQPASLNPQLSQLFPQAYGLISLISWYDPVSN
ncbi:hypothetical protein BYT27DRAFT_7308284 [Phlegmacium glaucopus]|nr:hypothetical protein BYT27DRAFT_7308284 [Phlegmacium glaucopus]